MIIDDVERIRLAILYILRIGPNHKSQELDGHHLCPINLFWIFETCVFISYRGHLHREIT